MAFRLGVEIACGRYREHFGPAIRVKCMVCYSYIPIFGLRLSEATDIFVGRLSLFGNAGHALLSGNDLE